MKKKHKIEVVTVAQGEDWTKNERPQSTKCYGISCDGCQEIWPWAHMRQEARTEIETGGKGAGHNL